MPAVIVSKIQVINMLAKPQRALRNRDVGYPRETSESLKPLFMLSEVRLKNLNSRCQYLNHYDTSIISPLQGLLFCDYNVL